MSVAIISDDFWRDTGELVGCSTNMSGVIPHRENSCHGLGSPRKPPPPKRPGRGRPPPIPHRPSGAALPPLSKPAEHAPRRTLCLPIKQQTSDLARLLCVDSPLPLCVRIGESLAGGSPLGYGLVKGDILLLHFVHEHSVVHARNSKGVELRLPVSGRQQYEILPLDPIFDDVEYSTDELLSANPLPKIVRVLDAHCSCFEEEDQTEGDIIHVQGIEQDEERGTVLVGRCNTQKIRYSAEMTTSMYTTMISPDAHHMSELIERPFPQRVRIPDLLKPFLKRVLNKETVILLDKVATETCVVATKAGDSHIFSIPVSAPIPLKAIDLHSIKGRSIDTMDLLSPLYPLVNPTWGLVDPTQDPMTAGMEAVPRPMELVLEEWLQSNEGEQKVVDAKDIFLERLKEDITQGRKELWSMKSDLDAAKKKPRPLPPPPPSPSPRDPSAPSLPPRTRDSNSGTGKDAAIKPPALPPRGPEQTMDKGKDSRCDSSSSHHSPSNINEYADLDEMRMGFNLDHQPMVEQMRNILTTKEMEIKELQKKIVTLQGKCTTLERENTTMKQNAYTDEDEYEELPDIPMSVLPKVTKRASASADMEYLMPDTDSNPSLLEFTASEVAEFLKEIGMAQYSDKFFSEDIDGTLLAALEDEHFKELGMTGLQSVKLKIQVNKRLGRITS